VSVPTNNGSAGIATDVSEAQKAQVALNRTIESHEKTFDELATAVVIFDKNHKLAFHNKAYSELFDLSESFLSSGPTDSEVIDKLRSLEKLPVEANFVQRAVLRGFMKTSPQNLILKAASMFCLVCKMKRSTV